MNIESLKILEIEPHIWFFIDSNDFKELKSILEQLNVCYIAEGYYKIRRLDCDYAIVIHGEYLKKKGIKELFDNRIRLQKLEKIN